MGNAVGQALGTFPGTVSLILDPPGAEGYVAGQKITGSVWCQSKKDLPGGNTLNVNAYISGKERSRVKYEEIEYYDETYWEDGQLKTRRQSRTVTRYAYAERELVKMAIHLADVTDGVRAGQRYQYPFEVTLPHDLPSSMHCQEHSTVTPYYGQYHVDYGGFDQGGWGPPGNGYCQITYKVKAELRGSGLFSTQKVEQQINVLSAPLPPEKLPNYYPPITRDITVCCCFSQGNITMGAKVDDTRIGQGEAAAIDFAVRNRAKRGIDRVQAKLVEDATWFAGGRQNFDSKVIATQNFRPTARWEAVAKEELKELKGDADDHRQTLKLIHDAIESSDNHSIITAPNSALQTYQGALITVRHYLKITVYMEGAFITNPRIEINMFIGTPANLLGNLKQSIKVAQKPPAEISGDDAPVEVAKPVVKESLLKVGGADVKQVEDPGKEEEEEDIVVPPLQEILEPSVPNLISEIKTALSPVATADYYLKKSDWKPIFAVIKPDQFVSIVKTVAVDFDKPTMAVKIAPAIENFLCEHVAAVVKAVEKWLRVSMVQKLIPFCDDLAKNKFVILKQLDEWQTVCTEKNFEDAIKKSEGAADDATEATAEAGTDEPLPFKPFVPGEEGTDESKEESTEETTPFVPYVPE